MIYHVEVIEDASRTQFQERLNLAIQQHAQAGLEVEIQYAVRATGRESFVATTVHCALLIARKP